MMIHSWLLEVLKLPLYLSHKSTEKIGFQGIMTCKKNTQEELIKALPLKKHNAISSTNRLEIRCVHKSFKIRSNRKIIYLLTGLLLWLMINNKKSPVRMAKPFDIAVRNSRPSIIEWRRGLIENIEYNSSTDSGENCKWASLILNCYGWGRSTLFLKRQKIISGGGGSI